MAITQAMCGSYKKEITVGIHYWMIHSRGSAVDIAADSFYIAMFTNSATLNEDTTGYTASNEVTGTNYTAKGQTLASVTLGLADNSSTVPTAFLDFADTTWGSSTISNARGALIYNFTLTAAGSGSGVNNAAYPAVAVLDFGGDKSSSSGDFTITYPANDANNALIRLA